MCEPLKTFTDIPVRVPDNLNLDAYLGRGRQPGEEELDVDVAPSKPPFSLSRMLPTPVASTHPVFNVEALSQLEAMGFPAVRCQRALLATGNASADMAAGWLFEHMDDPGRRLLSLRMKLTDP
jgi:ubiquitin carboxyl-terminal hydrolase 5/13